MNKTNEHKNRQSGNMILYLFGAVAVAGVLTSTIGNIVQGPMSAVADKHRRNMAETQLAMGAKSAAMAATKMASNGDCDGDAFVEPLEYRDAGAAPKPTGGGLVPLTIAMAKRDPWNLDYGYCAWDHGPTIDDAACGGATQKRLDGTNQAKWEAIAVISAGPDGIFQTSCNAWADVNTDNAPDTPLVNKPVGSDDVVLTWSFAEANAATAGLWTLKPADPNTAEIQMNLSVKDGSNAEQLSFDATTKELAIGAGGVANIPATRMDYLDVLLGTEIDFLNDIDLSGSYWADGNEIIDEDGMIQYGEQDPKITAMTNGKWCAGTLVGGVHWAQIETEYRHTCGIKTDGTLWCWGDNASGKLGIGTTGGTVNTPTQVGTDTNWSQVSVATSHTCALKTNGTLWCWGVNMWGNLGDGTTTDRSSPTQVGVATNWVQVSAAQASTRARKADGTMWGWGANSSYELGDGTTTQRPNPVQIGVATDWAYVGSQSSNACAVKTNGTLWCWGLNSFGQLGDGTTTTRTAPTQVGTDTNWAIPSPDSLHTCATKTNGTIWCWGANSNGQLGNGTTTSSLVPTQASGTNWASVDAGLVYTCGKKTDGTLWCWGNNSNGKLGDGTSTQRDSPTQVGTGADWAEVNTAESHTCARKSEGSLWCWGDNTYGQFGTGNTTASLSPVAGPGIDSLGEGVMDCTQDTPGNLGIQNGVPDGVTLGGGCAKLGELKSDSTGNLLVCDDTPSKLATGDLCTGFEPGSLTFDKDGYMYACANGPVNCAAAAIGEVCGADNAIYIGDISGNRIYAAATDSSFGLNWKTTNTSTTGTTSTTDGLANTDAMILAGAALHPAASECKNKSPAGTWYLPSLDEFNLIWSNRAQIDLLAKGFTVNSMEYYWTSTQISSNDSWAERLSDGFQVNDNKDDTDNHIRCVRR